MATVYQLKTFQDIIDAALEELGIQSTDTTRVNRLKRDINTYYIDEVVPFARWWWLRGDAQLIHEAAFDTGSASVTKNSTAVTLSETPSRSYVGYWFSVKGDQTRYKITEHTAGTSALVLSRPYIDTTAADRRFKIWTDEVALPANCNEVIEVYHDISNQPLRNYGLQEFRKLTSINAKREQFPIYYTTTDYKDPQPTSAVSGLPSVSSVSSSQFVKTVLFASTLGATASTALLRVGDRIRVTGGPSSGYDIEEAIVYDLSQTTVANDTIKYIGQSPKTETDVAPGSLTVAKANEALFGERYRNLLVYPSINSTNVQIHVDYVKEAKPLENGSDEPLIPLEYRSVLLYGALSRSWAKQDNEPETRRNQALADRKLAQMKGKLEDSPDKPQIRINQNYLGRTKATTARTPRIDLAGSGFSGGRSGSSSPMGTANQAAIFDADGRLASSPTINTTELSYLDGATSNIQAQLDALGSSFLNGTIALTTATLTDNTTDNVATFEVASFTSINLMYSITRGATVEVGQIKIISDGTSAWIATDFAGPGTTGVTFSADVSGTDLRLRYTTTSTGSAATMKYKGHKWLA